jgi:hypothetical protein
VNLKKKEEMLGGRLYTGRLGKQSRMATWTVGRYPGDGKGMEADCDQSGFLVPEWEEDRVGRARMGAPGQVIRCGHMDIGKLL